MVSCSNFADEWVMWVLTVADLNAGRTPRLCLMPAEMRHQVKQFKLSYLFCSYGLCGSGQVPHQARPIACCALTIGALPSEKLLVC